MERIGSYELREELARGAMGVVYRAFEPFLERDVALKVLPQEDLRDSESQRRFLLEARALARLRHSHIVSIHSAGVLPEQGYPYLVMDLIEGGTLEQLIQREGGHLDPGLAVRLARQLAEALSYAHERGVLHRDVKPQNVLLDQGDAVLTDFGLAKLYDAGADGLTRSGDRVGTPAYMAPEQASGQQGRIGPATDVYALGAILYRALGGALPHRADSIVDLFAKIAREEPAPLRQLNQRVDPALAELVHRCLAKRPEERFASARQLREALEAWETRRATDQTVRAQRDDLPLPLGASASAPPAARRAARSWGLALGLGLAGLAAGALGGVLAAERVEQTLRGSVLREELPLALQDRFNRAVERINREDFEGALADVEEIRAAEPRCPEAWLYRGRIKRSQGELEAALADVEQALVVEPELLEAHNDRGVLLHELKRLDEALRAFDIVCRELPAYANHWRNRASTRFDLKDYELALADVEQAKQADPRYADAYYLEGLILKRTQGPKAALPLFDKAIELEPTKADALNSRGLLKSELGDHEGSKGDYSAAIWGLLERKVIYHHNRGCAREELGDLQGALYDFDEAIGIDEEHALSFYKRGYVFLRLGNLHAGAADLRKALELTPPDDDNYERIAENANQLTRALERQLYEVISTGANLFDRPDSNAQVVAKLPAKTRVHLLRSQPPFAEVELSAQGRTIRGYVLQMRLTLVFD